MNLSRIFNTAIRRTVRGAALTLAFIGAGTFMLSQHGYAYLAHQAALGAQLYPLYRETQHRFGFTNLSYGNFKKDAGFYLMLAYDGDIARTKSMLDRMGEVSRFLCIPADENGTPSTPAPGDDKAAACHALLSSRQRKNPCGPCFDAA